MSNPTRSLVVLLAGMLMALPGAAFAAVGDWVAGENVRMRLVAAGVDLAGNLAAGIELELAPGWKTYWLNPGEAGIPPLADFSGSTNIGAVELDFPVPHRFGEGETLSNVYEGNVVFPITATVDDPGKPILLYAALDLGVCEEICIPVTVEAELAIKPGLTDIVAARLLTAAAAALPTAPEPGRFEVRTLAAERGDPGAHAIVADVAVPDPATAELFVAGPLGWYVGPAERLLATTGQARFRFPVQPHPAGPLAGESFVFVLVSGGKAIEQTMRLDD